MAFPEGWGAPTEVLADTLVAWKDMDMPAEGKAFSGTATYHTTFHIGKPAKGIPVILDLGKVNMIASVTVNGKHIGSLWCAPYTIDITDAVRKGENQLSIEVTSTWHNRLVYDASLPEDQRKTWVIGGPQASSALNESGLLGPVKVKY